MRFNKLIPEFSVSDFEASLKFYAGILGFKSEYSRPESKFAFLSLQGSQIMIEEINGTWQTGKLEKPFGRGINFQMEVADILPLLNSLKRNKYPIFEGPKDNWYRGNKQQLGTREFLVKDPDGYLLRFSQPLGIKPVR